MSGGHAGHHFLDRRHSPAGSRRAAARSSRIRSQQRLPRFDHNLAVHGQPGEFFANREIDGGPPGRVWHRSAPGNGDIEAGNGLCDGQVKGVPRVADNRPRAIAMLPVRPRYPVTRPGIRRCRRSYARTFCCSRGPRLFRCAAPTSRRAGVIAPVLAASPKRRPLSSATPAPGRPCRASRHDRMVRPGAGPSSRRNRRNAGRPAPRGPASAAEWQCKLPRSPSIAASTRSQGRANGTKTGPRCVSATPSPCAPRRSIVSVVMPPP